jgi:hypothetical protein
MARLSQNCREDGSRDGSGGHAFPATHIIRAAAIKPFCKPYCDFPAMDEIIWANSIGKGNTMVELLSPAMSNSALR